MLVPLWERMILRRLLRQLASAMSVLTALLVMLDFGLQASSLIREVGWQGLPLHYLLVVSKRFPMLASLSSVLASVAVAFQLVKHREWMALLAGGLSRRRLCRPFLLLSLCTGLLIAGNSQWLQPVALDRLDALEAPQSLKVAQLASGTTLICRKSTPHGLDDPIWISPGRLLVAKTLDFRSAKATGLLAFERTAAGWQRSSDPAVEQVPPGSIQPRWQSVPWVEGLPLGTLVARAWLGSGSSKVCAVAAQRTLLCLLPLLAAGLALPSVLVYRREAGWISPMLVGLTTVLAGMTLLEGAAVVSGLGALSCWWSFALPFVLALGLLCWRWWSRST